MEMKLTQSCLPTAISSSSSFSPHCFTLLAQRWKLHVGRISWKGQDISKKVLVHVVKKCETLASISKLYMGPILELAAASKDIVGVSLVDEGRHLHIPSNAGSVQMCHSEGNKLTKATASFRSCGRQWNQTFTVPTPCRLPIAKTTGPFLVLVPLIAFCIQCIMGAFRKRVAKNLRHEAANKSGKHHYRSNSTRWKTLLSDSTDPDAFDAESELDSGSFFEDQEQLHFEDISHTYTKLEDDYRKFLSECGMSNWGYWRGGSPE